MKPFRPHWSKLTRRLAGLRTAVARFWRTYKNNLKRDFWWALTSALILTISFQFLGDIKWFRALDAAIFDSLIRSHEPVVHKKLYVVMINDDDYQYYFQGKSPLEPAAVIALINSVVTNLNPQVVGVDIDTRDDSWKNLDLSIPRNNTRIVWATIPDDPQAAVDDTSSFTPPLGGSIQGDTLGFVALPQDDDGSVRRHQPRIGCMSYKGQTFAVQSFDQAIRKLMPQNAGTPQNSETCKERLRHKTINALKDWFWAREQYLDYGLSTFVPIQSNLFLDCISAKAHDGEKVCSGSVVPKTLDSSLASLMKGATEQSRPVVLIGGTFEAARDQYRTPLGLMNGVEILATEIATEGNWISSNRLKDIGLDLGCAALMFLFLTTLKQHPITAFIASAVALLLPLAFAGTSFFWIKVWLDPAGVMIGMVFSHYVEELHDLIKKRKELESRLAVKEMEYSVLLERYTVIVQTREEK